MEMLLIYQLEIFTRYKAIREGVPNSSVHHIQVNPIIVMV